MTNIRKNTNKTPLKPVNLRGIDLNLLRVLDALLTSNSVTLAAQQIKLSQPAVSAALKKLRVLLKDELFARTSHALVPTKRAQDLKPRIRQIFIDIEGAFQAGTAFDPAEDPAQFRVSVDDYIGLTVVPLWIKWLCANAPKVMVEFVKADSPAPHQDLVNGHIDLAIRVVPHMGAGIFRRKILDDHFVTIRRHQHPIKGEMSLHAFTNAGHALVSPYGGMTGSVDEALAKKGLERRVHMATPHFSAIPKIIAETDLIATVPSRIAALFVDTHRLRMSEPPLPIEPFSMYMVWHARTHSQPEQTWFRESIQHAMV